MKERVLLLLLQVGETQTKKNHARELQSSFLAAANIVLFLFVNNPESFFVYGGKLQQREHAEEDKKI